MEVEVSIVKNSLQQSFDEPLALFDRYVIDSFTKVKVKEDGTEKSIVKFQPPNDNIYLKARVKDGVLCGKATAYTLEGIVFARLFFCDGKLNGYCSFFDKDNVIISEGEFKNGNKDGVIIEYKGSVPHYSIWKDNLKVCDLEKTDSKTWREINIDGRLVAISQLDEKYQRNGTVLEFDESGVATCVSQWTHGTVQFIRKQFEGDKMTERSDSGDVIYKGSFENNESTLYPRSGYGEEFKSNMCIYKGHYVNNLRDGQGTFYHNGWRRYVGAWKNGFPHGKGTMFNKEGKAVVEDSDWEYGYCYVKYGWFDYDSDHKLYVPSRILLPMWVLRGGPVKSVIIDFIKNSKTNIANWYIQNRSKYDNPFWQWDLIYILTVVGCLFSIFSCRRAYLLSSFSSFIVSFSLISVPFISLLEKVRYSFLFLLVHICYLILVIVVDSNKDSSAGSRPATFIVFSVINIVLMLGFLIVREKDQIFKWYKKLMNH